MVALLQNGFAHADMQSASAVCAEGVAPACRRSTAPAVYCALLLGSTVMHQRASQHAVLSTQPRGPPQPGKGTSPHAAADTGFGHAGQLCLRTHGLTPCRRATLLPQALVDSEVRLALAPRLLGRLELQLGWWAGDPDNHSSPEEQQRLHADLCRRLGTQLAQCSGLQHLWVACSSFDESLHLASELVLAPGLPRLQHLQVSAPDSDGNQKSAAAAVLTAALTTRHCSRPDDAAAARTLRVTTNLVSEQGAEDVMRALGRVGVRGTRVVGCKYANLSA